MAQLQFLTLPEINMLVQMLNARVTFLESQWSSGPRTDPNVVNFPPRPPTTSLASAVPIVDPSVDKKCIICTRRFLHLKHRMCNRCARRLRRDQEKRKTQLTSGAEASSEDDESTVRPKFDPSKELSKELSSDASPFVPLKQVPLVGVKTPPVVKKRVVSKVTVPKAVANVKVTVASAVAKPPEQSALSIKLKPRSKVGQASKRTGGAPSVKVSVQNRKWKAVPSASGEDFPDPPADMVRQPKYKRGYGPCPKRFDVVPETESETALWTLRKEWQGYADQEAAYEIANMSFLAIARNVEGVLHTDSGKHVKAYSFVPEMSMRQDTLRYLEIHPEVQPWIMRVGPQRSRYSLEPLKWTRPSWIGKRKTPCKRKYEQKKNAERPPNRRFTRGVESSDILDPRQFARDSRPGSPAELSSEVPSHGAVGVPALSSFESGDSSGATGGAKDVTPQKVPAKVKELEVVSWKGIMPPVMIFDSDDVAVQGQAYTAFHKQIVDAFTSDDKKLQSEAKAAANSFWQVLFRRGIVDKDGAVVKRPEWLTKQLAEQVFVILTSKD